MKYGRQPQFFVKLEEHLNSFSKWKMTSITTSKEDVQNKEDIIINSDSTNITLMTTGTLVLLSLSVVEMSTDIVNPISNKSK